MKALLEILVFLGTFFGLFIALTVLICLIFPTSWNDVVTCIPWLIFYLIFGGILSGCVVDDYSKSIRN